MTADWRRARFFKNSKQYVDAIAVLFYAYGKLKNSWGISCKINIKCWSRACNSHWIKRDINIGMRTIGVELATRSFDEYASLEYLLEDLKLRGFQFAEITMVHEYAHIVTGVIHNIKCNHGPRYQEIYAVMLDEHFNIGAVRKFEAKHPTVHYGGR